MKRFLSKFTNIVSCFLAIAFAIQLFSAFSSVIINNKYTNSISLLFFRFFEALGTIFTSNCLPFSILLGIVFVFGILKSQTQTSHNKNQPKPAV